MSARTLSMAIGGAGSLILAGALRQDGLIELARLALCGGTLAAAAVVDLREHRIPNRLVLPAALGCFLLAAVAGVGVASLAIGLAVVAGLLALALARPQALGMGDVKLALLVVAALDGRAVEALALGLVLAALVGLVLLVRYGRTAGKRALPLAPFIATGSLLALLA